MKKLSRFLALLLIVLMLATMAVSCKKEDDEDEGYNEGSGYSDGEGAGDGTGEDGEDGNGGSGSGGSGKKSGSSGSGSGSGSGSKSQGGQAVGQTHVDSSGNLIDEEGNIIETNVNRKIDDDYRIIELVDNNNAFIPDEEQGLEKSARRATEASKYNFDQNPLINRDRQQNKTWEPSFNIDDTGFVRAGTKLADLKGKTLSFFTADTYSAWSYRNEKGETIDERAWFKQLKDKLKLTIKYTVSSHMEGPQKALQYMNAGKQLDVFCTSQVTFPSGLCISRSITGFVNINDLGSSPGVCKRTMDLCKWGNTLRLIAPIGCVDLIWYNQTLTQELGLSDPHTMWEKGAWNWDTFKKYQLSVPKKTNSGANLISFVQWADCHYVWPSTNGSPEIFIDADAEKPALINNWDQPETMEAWEFITGVCNSVNYRCGHETSPGVEPNHLGLYEGTTLMSAAMFTQVYRDTEYSKHVQINWVPYPKSTSKGGTELCRYFGYGMLLPRKTIKEDNVNIALKFMELWATRFTETIFDNLNTFEYYNFNYKMRKQYFDFVTKNVGFALSMNDFIGSDLRSSNFFKCFEGDPAYNVKTEAQKVSNIVRNYIIDSLKFGQ